MSTSYMKSTAVASSVYGGAGGALNKNKSTSMLSLFSGKKGFVAKRAAKKLQNQTSNGYGSYSNLFSAASYGSMCSLDKAGKKGKKKH